MIILASSTAQELAEEVAKKLNLNCILIESKVFPDGESYVRIPDFESEEVLFISSLYYPQDTNLVQAINVISTLKRLGTKKITFFAPYLCYARADRDILGREAISSNTILKLLEASGVDRLITLDIHNPEIFKFTKMKTTNIFPSKALKSYISNNSTINLSVLQVVAPDKGASERAKIIADELGVTWTSLNKTRDPRTGELNMDIGDAQINGKEVLLVDDLSATGSSLIRASNLLQIYGVRKIHIFITHLMNSQIIERLHDVCTGLLISSTSIPSLISLISPVEDLIEVLK